MRTNMRNLLALCTACLAATGIVAACAALLPSQDVADQGLEYGYVLSGTKSESVDFTLAAAHEDTYFLFGSSELATIPEVVPTAPDRVLREYDCGMQFMYIGDAYDQSLWMAIAAGAYAPDMPNKKCAIIVSPQWFLDGGLEPGLFKMRFSYNLYQRFCANEGISQKTKDFVASRLIEEGVDRAVVDGADPRLPQDYIDGTVFSVMNDLRLRQALGEVRLRGTPRTAPLSPPDFTKLRQEAVDAAQRWTTTNEYGIFDDYWTAYIEQAYGARENELAGETLTRTPEYGDLSCFLDVCEEAGLDPYVIIMPVNAAWYDYAGLTSEVRGAFYERVRTMCAQRGVECLDLSVHEYERYYMRDIMHLGWLGWVDVEEGFGGFVGKGDR